MFLVVAIPFICIVLVGVSVWNDRPTLTVGPTSQMSLKHPQHSPALGTVRIPSDVGSKVHEAGMKFFFHIADTHVDPYFDPTQTMGVGMCHSCLFSRQAHGSRAFCPTTLPFDEAHLAVAGYPFGRYKCNPPRRLLTSLFESIKRIEPQPRFMVHTGDIAPHGFPDDKYPLTQHTKLEDLCPTKRLIMQRQIRILRQEFPKTKFAFAMGNNDHFPKNTFWPLFISWFGDMLREEGFLSHEEHRTFVEYGSYYFDADELRFLCVDLTLFIPGGETHFVDERDLEGLNFKQREEKRYPVRSKAVKWIAEVLADAKAKNRAVYLVGHQPLATKKGRDEMAIASHYYSHLKDTLDKYQDLIRVGFFGHRNYAGIQPILNSLQRPIIPTITVPGVSPRGMNQPSFNIVFYDPKTYTIMDFEQWLFDLAEENAKAVSRGPTYMGKWKMHHRDLYSWAAWSEANFTIGPLVRVLHRMTTNMTLFFRYEMWKRAGYVGDETPENYNCKALYDVNEAMMHCLFENQEERCWDRRWLA